MKVLMLSLDQTLLKDGSKSQKRMIDYGSIVDELHIILYTPRKPYESCKIGSNVFIYPTNSRLKPLYFGDAFRLGCKIGGDMITAQDAFPTGVVGYLLKKKLKIPLQIQVHIDFFSPYFVRERLSHRLSFWCSKFLLPKADNVRVISYEIKNYVMDKLKVPPAKIIVLPVFANVQAVIDAPVNVHLRQKYPQFKFLILMTTRLVKQKNIGMAIIAVREIVKRYPEIGLIIVGSGPEEETLKALSRGAEANIIFEPWTYDVYSYYKDADVFVLTSNYEGWALTVTEAMAAGLPVVATPVGCANEVIKNGESGLIVSRNDSAGLARAIELLYTNPEKRKEIAAKGQEAIKNFKPVTKEEYLGEYLRGFKMTVLAGKPISQ